MGSRDHCAHPSHDPALIKRVLDIGVDGIMAPMVMNAEDAQEWWPR
jgi:2-keto-3-deoxy-L-rhamnonate aldolase RhmA